jgi:hypothetical protein
VRTDRLVTKKSFTVATLVLIPRGFPREDCPRSIAGLS